QAVRSSADDFWMVWMWSLVALDISLALFTMFGIPLQQQILFRTALLPADEKGETMNAPGDENKEETSSVMNDYRSNHSTTRKSKMRRLRLAYAPDGAEGLVARGIQSGTATGDGQGSDREGATDTSDSQRDEQMATYLTPRNWGSVFSSSSDADRRMSISMMKARQNTDKDQKQGKTRTSRRTCCGSRCCSRIGFAEFAFCFRIWFFDSLTVLLLALTSFGMHDIRVWQSPSASTMPFFQDLHYRACTHYASWDYVTAIAKAQEKFQNQIAHVGSLDAYVKKECEHLRTENLLASPGATGAASQPPPTTSPTPTSGTQQQLQQSFLQNHHEDGLSLDHSIDESVVATTSAILFEHAQENEYEETMSLPLVPLPQRQNLQHILMSGTSNAFVELSSNSAATGGPAASPTSSSQQPVAEHRELGPLFARPFLLENAKTSLPLSMRMRLFMLGTSRDFMMYFVSFLLNVVALFQLWSLGIRLGKVEMVESYRNRDSVATSSASDADSAPVERLPSVINRGASARSEVASLEDGTAPPAGNNGGPRPRQLAEGEATTKSTTSVRPLYTTLDEPHSPRGRAGTG
ncbi:unnamed protein product, partial [Amoebophrya sp. A25]